MLQAVLRSFTAFLFIKFSESHLCSVSHPVDLWLLIDGSMEIGNNFQNELSFGASIIKSLPQGSRVSVIQVASWAQTESTLMESRKALDKLLATKPIGGSYQLGYGLSYTRKYEMAVAMNRADIADYVLILSATKSVDDPYPPAQKLRDNTNATTVCIGVLDTSDEIEMLEIAGDPRQLITVPTFQDLQDMFFLDTVLETMCKGDNQLAEIQSENEWSIGYCEGVQECAFRDANRRVHNLCKCWSDRVGTVCSEQHAYNSKAFRCHKPLQPFHIERCQDKQQTPCKSWSESDQCFRNHELMSNDCPQTCGFCDLRACDGIERCANEMNGMVKPVCQCNNPFIGAECSKYHPWGGTAFRCYNKPAGPPAPKITEDPKSTVDLISNSEDFSDLESSSLEDLEQDASANIDGIDNRKAAILKTN